MHAAPPMDQGSAELLRAVLQALHDDESLDEFVDEHSEKFRDYEPEGEQSLAWGSLHAEYVELVERVLESVLSSGRGSADDLYALLDAHRESMRGQRFLDKLYVCSLQSRVHPAPPFPLLLCSPLLCDADPIDRTC